MMKVLGLILSFDSTSDNVNRAVRSPITQADLAVQTYLST